MDDVVHIANETVRKVANSTRLQAIRIREREIRGLRPTGDSRRAEHRQVRRAVEERDSHCSEKRKLIPQLITENYIRADNTPQLPPNFNSSDLGALFNLFFR